MRTIAHLLGVLILAACGQAGTGGAAEARTDTPALGDLPGAQPREVDGDAAGEVERDAGGDLPPADLPDLSDLSASSDIPAELAPSDSEGSDSSDLLDTSSAPVPTPAWFSQVLAAQDASGFQEFMSCWDGPVCDQDVCLVVTRVDETPDPVDIRGGFNDWNAGTKMTPVPFAPDFEYFVLEGYPFDGYVEYKLYIAAADKWITDPLNRWIRFSDVAINSAIYRTGVSRLALVEGVESPQLGNVRELYVYVPAAAWDKPGAKFPVIYMQDGFNVFDNPMALFGSWEVNLAADALIEGGEIPPLVIVGIGTNDRLNEYLYTDIVLDLGGGDIQIVPKLDPYADFLVSVVMPLVESQFPVKMGPAHTAISGSSLGGLSALYIGWKYPDRFGNVAALSSSFWVGEPFSGTEDHPSMRDILTAAPVTPEQKAMRIYLDSGDLGEPVWTYASDGRVYTDWVRNTLIALGWPNRPEWDDDGDLSTPPLDFPFTMDPEDVPTLYWSPTVPDGYAGWDDYLRPDLPLLHLVGVNHDHNEAAWKARFPDVLRYLNLV